MNWQVAMPTAPERGVSERVQGLNHGILLTEKQERTTAPGLDEVQARECGGDIDSRGDHGNDKGVLDAGAGEERSAVVENEVLYEPVRHCL